MTHPIPHRMPHPMPHPWTRRRWLSTLGSAAAASALPARAWATDDSAPATRQLEIAGPWEMSGLALAQSGHLYQKLQVIETLLEASSVGQPAAGLATTWSQSPDGLRWQFDLRPGARFHDGSRVRAADAVAALQAATQAPGALSQAPVAGLRVLASADGRESLEILLHRPHATLPSLLGHFSTAVLAPGSWAPDGRTLVRILGSGPYRITRLEAPQRLEVAWFDGEGGPAPQIRRAGYLAVGRAETRALMAASGQADLVFALDPASLAKWRRTVSPARLASVTVPRVMALKLNAGAPVLSDARVRQALSLAIDREGIASAILRDPGLAATQLLPPTVPDWHDPSLPPLTFDLERAAGLLRAAGWRRSAEDRHWRDVTGQPVALTLRTFPDRPELPIVATALQEQWRQLGLPVRVSIGNSGDIPLGHRDGSLQIGLMARNYASTPDLTASLWQDFRPGGHDWGAMGWQSPPVWDALAALNSGADLDRAAALRRQVVQGLQRDLPVIPVAWYRQHVAVSRRVQRPVLDPLERSYRLSALRWTDGDGAFASRGKDHT